MRTRRKSSCAFISIPSKDASAAAVNLGGQQLECVGRVQDPEMAEIDRQRRISWSATVGSTDSRSVDTGLNELHRITAEGIFQERLLNIRSELTEMEQGSKTTNHVGRNQSQLHLRSLSCPLIDSDQEDDSASSIGSCSPNTPRHKPIKRSSTSMSAIVTSTQAVTGVDAAFANHSPYMIPRVITTNSVGSLISDHQLQYGQDLSGEGDVNAVSPSTSMDDVESSSVDPLDSGEAEELDTRERRSFSLLETQLDEDGLTPGYSISAPDLFRQLSDDNEEQVTERQSDNFKSRTTVSVEESIMEHRSLRQVGAYSPVSDDQRDTGTDHTNTSLENDFVIVASPCQTTHQQDTSDSDKESGQSIEVTRHSAPSASQGKTHRRSLSTSDMEAMRSAEMEEEREDEEEEGREDNTQRPNTTNCIAVLTPISNADEGDTDGGTPSYSRKLDVDEHSQAGSVQTLDTSSHHGSDDSSDDEDNRETDDQLSALDSQVSLEPVVSEPTSSTTTTLHAQVNYNGVSNLSPIVLRGGKRRSVNPLNRYSAECLSTTNIDDDMAVESDDGDATPTSNHVMFSHRRINSTSVPLTTINHPSETTGVELEEDTFDEVLDHSMDDLSLGNVDGKKMSQCSSDSVFVNSTGGEVVDLSDVDVKVNSDDGTAQSIEYSFDMSLEKSCELDEHYFKQTGSPKTLKKRFSSKSPITRRRVTTKSEKKGLQKADVSPTIRTLRKLMDLDELEDSLSDDSDTTMGSGPVRTASALGRSFAPTVHRSSSSVSDSITERKSPVVTASRSPLLQPANLLANPDEGSSLDFLPGSPLAARKHNPPMPPASPLSVSITKSPPASFHGISTVADKSNDKGRSSNSSPTLGNLASNSKLEEEELYEEDRVAKPSQLSRRRTAKFEKSKSLFESGTTEASLFTVGPKEPSRDLDESKPLDKDHGSSMKKFIRGSFFRGSKQKVPKTISNENMQESPVVTYNKRVKSAKLRNKPSESSLEAIPSSPSSSITRSASMQVGLEEAAEVQSNSKHMPATQMTRHNSEDVLSSPSKLRSAQSLTILEEKGSIGKSVAFPFIPASHGSEGESDNEVVSNIEQLGIHANRPELHVKEELAWERTVDRKLYKKINKGERERQAILHEMLHTEKQHFRALHVLKLIFRHGINKQVSEDELDQLFPKLDELIEISKGFIKRMEKKKAGNMINDLSDTLLYQFSGETCEQMLSAFSGFCSGHLYAMEIYRELLKKKNFARLMTDMYSLKECQRLTLPDYYTKVTQRLSQLITLMIRLAKKTESLKLDHFPVLRESMVKLQSLVAAVDQSVEDRKNRMEVMDIESRLEINVPKSSKISNSNKQDIKSLSLTAHNRMLRKREDATWMGHGRQLSVQVVLVTDLLVLLTERDQKFHLAALQDLKPPVIRLYDLMVRPNVSVKSGVQLLLVEQSSTPEMYKLDFVDKRKAKEWLSILNKSIEECKEKGFKCESFGAERVITGDEDKKHEEKEGESGEEGKGPRDKSAILKILPAKSDPEVQRHKRARETIEVAQHLLSTVNSVTADSNVVTRHQDPAAASNSRVLNLRQRHTVRPKTTYFDDVDVGRTTATITGHGSTSGPEHVISHPQPPQLVSNTRGSKPVKEKKKVNRSATFRSKEKKEDKKEEKEKEKLLGVAPSQRSSSEDSNHVSEQLYVDCIIALKSCLEEMTNVNEEQTKKISKLQDDVQCLQKSIKVQQHHHHHKGKRKDQQKQESPASTHQHSPCTSPPPSYSPQLQPNSVGVATDLDHSHYHHHTNEATSDLSSEAVIQTRSMERQEAKSDGEDDEQSAL